MRERRRKSSRLLELVWKQRFRSFSFAAHGFALVCVAAAVALHFVFEAPGVRIAPFATLFPAILIASIAGGLFAGLTALVAGGVAAWLFLIPQGTLLVTEASQIASLLLYASTGLFLIVLVTLMRRAAGQLDVSRELAQDDRDRLVAALEASGGGTWRWDIQNDVVEWDDALCRMYGVERKDAPRKSAAFFEIVHPEDRAYASEVVRQCIEEGVPAEYEFRAVVPKGTLTIYDRSTLIRDAAGKPAFMLGACLDITERRRAEEQQGRLTTWLGMAMDVARIGTWEIDARTRLVTGSDTMNEFFDLPGDGQPRPFSDYLARVHPDDAAKVEEALARRTEKGEPVSVEYRVVREDGGVCWLASRGALVRGADGHARVVGSLFDITERKHNEEEREAALQQRELLLRELNHRVKNNLQMVSSLLSLQASRMDDPEAKEHFRKAMDRVQAIGDIHARLYQGDQLGRIDFDEYLKDLCERLEDSMPDSRSVLLYVDAEPVDLDIDRAIPLGLIVNELVTNSIKHAFPDGAKGTISVQLRRGGAGETLRLTIADDGQGVREEGENRKGLGSRLIEGLMQQVGGRMERRTDGGVRYEIVVPDQAPAPPDTTKDIARPGNALT